MRKTDYFKLGLYIIIGTVLLLTVVVVLGAGRIFEHTVTMETYLQESINGLEVGSSVKFQGVKIGRVSDVGFVASTYVDAAKSDIRYVLVRFDVDPTLIGLKTEAELRTHIEREIERGLRVRPTTLGLTGQLFLNLDYVDPAAYPPLPVKWKPRYIVLPSMPSTMSRIEQAITTISDSLSGLNKADLQAIVADAKSIVAAASEFMKTEGAKEAGVKLLGLMDQSKQLLTRTNQLLADPATERLIPELTGAVKGVREVVADAGDDIVAAAKGANQAMASLRTTALALEEVLGGPRTREALTALPPALENLSKASGDLAAAVSKIHLLTNRLNSMVAAEETNIHGILEDARSTMGNLKELSGEIKRHPSGALFGQPPKPVNPGQDQ